jgi:hypothetical protein
MKGTSSHASSRSRRGCRNRRFDHQIGVTTMCPAPTPRDACRRMPSETRLFPGSPAASGAPGCRQHPSPSPAGGGVTNRRSVRRQVHAIDGLAFGSTTVPRALPVTAT